MNYCSLEDDQLIDWWYTIGNTRTKKETTVLQSWMIIVYVPKVYKEKMMMPCQRFA
jgi:hypothetical protein